GVGDLCRIDDLVPAPDLGDDLEVVLQVEQCGQRGPDQRLVVGEEKTDRHGAGVPARGGTADAAGRDGSPPAAASRGSGPAGTCARSRHPRRKPPASMVPPTAASRSVSPVSPFPMPALI